VPASEVHRGDVVSVRDAAGTRVTHRVVSVATQGEQRQLTLKGDANAHPDAEAYNVTEAQRVFLHVPRLGYVVGWLTGPIGLFLLGLYAALLLSVVFRREPPGNGRPSSRARRRASGRRTAPRRRTRVHAALAVAVTALAVLVPAPGWSAPWTDDVTISGTTLTAHLVAAPDSTTCSVSSPNATIAWPEKDARYDYEAVLKRADNSVVSTRQVTGAAVSQTYTATGDFGFGLLALGTYDFTVEIRSYLAATPAWRGAGVLVASQQIRITIILVLFIPVLGTISCV
jgi:hypothetical protein